MAGFFAALVIVLGAAEGHAPAIADAIAVMIVVRQIAGHISHALSDGFSPEIIMCQAFKTSAGADADDFDKSEVDHEESSKNNAECCVFHSFLPLTIKIWFFY